MPLTRVIHNVDVVSVESPRPSCYLVEWYWPELSDDQLEGIGDMLENGAAAVRGEGSPVDLLITLAVPMDETFFGVFAASSGEAVSEACRRAGLPAERLTEGVDFHIMARGYDDSASNRTL